MYNYDVDLLMMSRVNARNMQRILINVLYVFKQEFSASSWRSNQGYTKMLHGQPTIKINLLAFFIPSKTSPAHYFVVG
jgi:hypothetical protein